MRYFARIERTLCKIKIILQSQRISTAVEDFFWLLASPEPIPFSFALIVLSTALLLSRFASFQLSR